MSDYGYICPICSEPIREQDATEHTDDGLAHANCCTLKMTDREKKVNKAHGREIRLGLCDNCHQRMVLPDGKCMQCGHGPRIGLASLSVESVTTNEADATAQTAHTDTTRQGFEATCQELFENLGKLLHQIENHCPCGARPESFDTHPHVSGCPVSAAIIHLGWFGIELDKVKSPASVTEEATDLGNATPTPSEETGHEIKCWPEYFEKIADGSKTFELRRNDRGYSLGAKLIIREWEPLRQDPHCEVHHYHMGDGHCSCYENGNYTGKQIIRYVAYIMQGGRFGLHEGYVCMSLAQRVPQIPNEPQAVCASSVASEAEISSLPAKKDLGRDKER